MLQQILLFIMPTSTLVLVKNKLYKNKYKSHDCYNVSSSCNYFSQRLQSQKWSRNTTQAVNCAYVIVDLSWWKIQYPQKSLCCFRDPKKSQRAFIDPKKSVLAKMSDPKKSFGPPFIKICEWGPWGPLHASICLVSIGPINLFKKRKSLSRIIRFNPPIVIDWYQK